MTRLAIAAAALLLGQQPAPELSPERQAVDRLIETGNLANQQKKYQEQHDAFSEAASRAREAKWRLAECLNGLGTAEWRLGDLENAKSHLSEAVAAWGEDSNRAASLSNLGMVLDQLGEYESAARAYQEAYPAFAKSKPQQAILLNNIARLYASLGDLEAAANYYDQAARILEQAKDRARMAQALANLGAVKVKMGEASAAEKVLMEALASAEPGSAVEADARNYMGRALAGLNQADSALASLDRSTEIARALGDRTREARALHETALVLHARGESQQALDRLAEAKQIRDRQGAVSALADTIASSAEIRLDLGQADVARTEIEDAIAKVEAIRTGVPQEQLRGTYLASKQRYYDTWVESLVQLHERNPAAGYVAQAFQAAEQARARTLLDLLRTETGEVRVSIDPVLLEQQRRLRNRIRSLARQAGKREDLQAAQSELLQLEMRIRAASPSYAALVDPKIATVSDVAALLDADSLLLKLWLGRRRSFGWLIPKSGQVEHYLLPARAGLEATAKQAFEELSSRSTRPASAAAHLGAVLFPRDLTKRFDGKRLVLVTDGALEYVPFAALVPQDSRQPLSAKWEIVQLPSASLLAELRRKPAGIAGKALALIVDPVFEPEDSRLPKASGQAGEPLSRLAFSAREGAAIERICGRARLTPYSGFAARKNLFTDGSLAGHAIIHFSSHALIDAVQPEASRLAFSQFDSDGRAIDGMLRLYDLYRVKLDADLVVLSACRTGIGKELRGEGMIGFSRAFFYPGARCLVVSLWRVDDEASAELMANFYEQLFRRGLSAPGALRAAQAALRADPRWRSPYYWAGFTVQGDWMGVPRMVRSSDGARRGRPLSQTAQR